MSDKVINIACVVQSGWDRSVELWIVPPYARYTPNRSHKVMTFKRDDIRITIELLPSVETMPYEDILLIAECVHSTALTGDYD